MADASKIDFSPTVKSYITQLRDCKPIGSKTRERQLIRKAKKGDSSAQNAILTGHLRYVFNIAKKYRGYGIPMEDLISEGNMGLLHAITKYSESKGTKFITYASWWIKFYMSDHIKRTAVRKQVERNEDVFMNEWESINNIKDGDNQYFNSDSDVHIDEDGNSMYIQKRQNELISELLHDLDDREKFIIENYYGIGGINEKNLEEISKIIGISKERTRQIKQNALTKMRSEVLLMDGFDKNIF